MSQPFFSVRIDVPEAPAIQADLYLPENRKVDVCLVLCHGYTAFRRYSFFPWLADRLRSEGFSVLVMEFSHSGDPDEAGRITRPEVFGKNTFEREFLDIKIVLDAVREGIVYDGGSFSASRVGILGHSRGGTSALYAGAYGHGIEAMVTWCTMSNLSPERFGVTPEVRTFWEQNGVFPYPIVRTGQEIPLERSVLKELDSLSTKIEELAKAVKVPALICHAADDETIDVGDAGVLHSWINGSEIFILENADHVFNVNHPMKVPSQALEAVTERTIQFFRERLLSL